MKRQLLGVAAILLSISTYAQDNPLWMRYCAISPDGTTIAFTYKGDIYTVPSTGGRASQITTNPAHDTKPIWSPDGKKIAFASDRMGSMDIFEVNKEGGIPKRLTTHSGNETPVAYKDAGHILFLANIMPTAEDAQFPSGQFQQVYEVNTEGGRPILFSSMPMEDISINHTGNTLLYHDKKGYEDPWRKHHTSSITRDIWLCSLNGNRTFRKQTAFNGEDRTPVWASDDKSFYYLSEEKGSFNIFKRDIDGNTSKQITNHTKHPVRFLSAASNGTLCYGYDGEIYTVKEGAIPQKVQISIVTDKNDKDLIRQIKRSGATEISLSPDAKEIAFVLRGDVYVTSTEYSTTKQITNTPQQERDIHFSPDGRSIVYASERNGLWQIYQTSLAKKEEKQFAYATDIKEERLTNSDITSFQPQYSPDGKEVAFLENRTTIRVLNLKSKAVRTVMDGKYEYSYSDGDQWYQWSPDSKWILTNYIGIGGWNNKDVALVNASGNGEIHNLTESGYSDGNAKWVLDGKAMIWESDRAGFRSHGSWGAEADIYIMFFDLDAYDRFRMSKEELALLEDSEKKDKEKSEEKEKADHKKDKKKEARKEFINMHKDYFKNRNIEDLLNTTTCFTDIITEDFGYATIRKVETDEVYCEIALGHTLRYLNYVAFSYDSRYVAIVGRYPDFCSYKGLLLVYDMEKQKEIEKNTTHRAVWTAAFTQKGFYAAYDSLPTLLYGNVNDDSVINEISDRNFLAFSPDGKYMALSNQCYVAYKDENHKWGHQPSTMVYIHSVENPNEQIVPTISDLSDAGVADTNNRKSVASCSFSLDNKKLMMVGRDGIVVIRNLHIE